MINLFSWYLAVNIENRDRLKNSRTVDRGMSRNVYVLSPPSHAVVHRHAPPRPKDRVRECRHNHRPHVRLGWCLKLGISIPIRQWGGGVSHPVSSCCNDALVVGTISRTIWTPLFSGVIGIFNTKFLLFPLFFYTFLRLLLERRLCLMLPAVLFTE